MHALARIRVEQKSQGGYQLITRVGGVMVRAKKKRQGEMSRVSGDICDGNQWSFGTHIASRPKVAHQIVAEQSGFVM